MMVMLKLEGGEEEGKKDRQVENWNIKTVTNLVPIISFIFGKIPQTKS